MYSLRKKLTKSLVINLLLLMLLLLGGLNLSIQQLLKDHVLTRLQHDADSLVSLLRQNEQLEWMLNPEHMSTIYSRVRSGHYYAVDFLQQKIRSRSLFDFEVNLKPHGEGYASSYQMDGPGDENWLAWQQTVTRNKQVFQVWVAEDMTPVYGNLKRFFILALVTVLLATLISIYVQHKILNRAFIVFDELRRNLLDMRHGQSEKSIALVPLEVYPLVKEIKILVEQLGQRIVRTRNAIGNLSHELKRPLQIVSMEVDAFEHDHPVRRALDEIKSIVDRELRRARISGSPVGAGVVQIKEEAGYLLEVMHKIYAHQHIRLYVQQGLNEVSIDRDDLLELMGNLIDNACKFARSEISVDIRADVDNLYLKIEDDGPGVKAEQLQAITVKGMRLDENVQGHGLGLNICSDIVRSYHGSLLFNAADLGGLKVEVVIPLRLF